MLPGVLLVLLAPIQAGQKPAPVAFLQSRTKLKVQISGRPFATYHWSDPQIRRPFFAHVHAPDGTQVTRAHPPVEGKDATDHATMHPGIWLAFGELSGADFWRNEGEVKHVEFVEPPRATAGGGRFAVRNRYIAGGRVICEEVCRITIRPRTEGTWIDWTSEFSSPEEFSFGDQEEMGLGVRVATPLAVVSGGQILDSEGRKNENQVWGKPADWCDYSGAADGKSVGITLMPDPRNFRRSWFHARDYGLLVANPFGRHALTGGETSKVVVRPGETFLLRFGILVHSGPIDIDSAYKSWINERKPASRPAEAPR
jgi:hypothetical protein